MRYHLAQCNTVRLRAPIDSPIVAGFVAALNPINALADSAPGFVWRLQTDEGDATSIRVFDDGEILLNMSVWESIEALSEYVYRSGHREVLRKRRLWADHLEQVHVALWWVLAGTVPQETDAVDRLDLLARNGPGPDAFTFQSPFPAPVSDGEADTDDGAPRVEIV